MRNLKLLFVALSLTFCATTYAGSVNPKENRLPVSAEIGKMLTNSNLVIEKNFTVKVVFKVTGDRTIDIRSITSPNEEVNAFLEKRLQGQKLSGNGWFTEKIYELPVKVESKR